MASTILLSDNGATSGISGYQLTGGTDGTLTVQTTTSGGTPTTAVSIDNTQNTTVAGNLTLSGSAKRITGDFSNATIANRALLQTSTTNGATTFSAIPNGTNTTASISAINSSDATNGTVALLQATSGEVAIRSVPIGTGTYLPMTFYTGGSERMRLDTSGNVGIGTSSPDQKLSVAGQISLIGLGGATPSGARGYLLHNSGASVDYGVYLRHYNGTVYDAEMLIGGDALNGGSAIRFQTNAVERMRIDSSGNVLVTNPAGLGYGTGSGGTVTQATNKSTAVTLNKPTGQITINGSALAAGAEAVFVLNNTIVTAVDAVVVQSSNGNYLVRAYGSSSGTVNIGVKNNTGGSLSETPVLYFYVIKGAIS